MAPAQVRLSGPGLHTGRTCAVSLAPGADGSGWTLNGTPVRELEVSDTRMATTLLSPRGPVMTVEHLFAALGGLGVRDVALEVEGGEVPVLDGSAAAFCAAIRRLGLARPGLPTRPLSAPVEVHLGAARLSATPAEHFSFSVSADLGPLGTGLVEGDLGGGLFETALAPARTFGFARDAAALQASGRALGASLECCLVFDDSGELLEGQRLRFANEPFRHKALDLVGDLARLGWFPRATVRADRAGHTSHARLVEALRAACS